MGGMDSILVDEGVDMHALMKLIAAASMMVQMASPGTTGGKVMEAKGTFEVKVTPVEATAFEKSMGAGRYEIDKTWAGGVSGTSKGEMLTSLTESTGAMAYVAMEQVTAKLEGRSGTFYLAHRATMTKGDAASGEMHIVVVKGSGTGELAGLSGELKIVIDATGRHSYVLDYELP
jgi:hypothetical protein